MERWCVFLVYMTHTTNIAIRHLDWSDQEHTFVRGITHLDGVGSRGYNLSLVIDYQYFAAPQE